MTGTIEELTSEKEGLNQRLDSILNVTQKDRVDSTLHKLEIDTYLKQIEAFKQSDLKLKK